MYRSVINNLIIFSIAENQSSSITMLILPLPELRRQGRLCELPTSNSLHPNNATVSTSTNLI